MTDTLNSFNCSDENIEANRKYHDSIAGRYENDPRVYLGILHPNCAKRLQWLKRSYSIPPQAVVLNLGTGTGNLMQKSEELFGCTIGIDISFKMLELAKCRTDKLIQGNALNIPLKNNSMDVVFCVAVLHHIYDLKKLFTSIYQVLKPGGVFYSDYDPNRRFYKTIYKFPALKGLLFLYKKISDLFVFTDKEGKSELRKLHDMAEYHEVFLRGMDPEEIKSIVEEAGFCQVQYICHSDAPDLNHPRKGRLIHKISELALRPFSENYSERAKIFSIVAVKEGK